MLRIFTVVVTPFLQNSRLIVCSATKIAAVVDPGGEIEKIIALIEEEQVDLRYVFLTHAHLDHAGGVEPLRRRWGELGFAQPLLLAHRNEREFRASVSETASFFGLSADEYQNVSEPDRYLEEGDIVEIGDLRGKVLFTPGHSPGHISMFFEAKDKGKPVLIAGDTLFAGSIGRTDLPGGNFETLIQSIEEKILVLPDETLVLSGHGPDTTVFREKRGNPFLMAGRLGQ